MIVKHAATEITQGAQVPEDPAVTPLLREETRLLEEPETTPAQDLLLDAETLPSVATEAAGTAEVPVISEQSSDQAANATFSGLVINIF